VKLYERLPGCVLCRSADMYEAVPLEPMPIATPNYSIPEGVSSDVFREGVPLGIFQCRDCGHLQVMHIGNPELQYRDYVYTTSISLGLPEHFRTYAADIIAGYALPADGLVVEVGSNDGTLLRAFRETGRRVIGIDPARRIAEEASAAGIPTLAEFFGADVAGSVLRSHGQASLIIANNVMANLANLDDVAAGIANLLAPDGVFVFETQYGADVVERTLLDTVYHEHISYFLLKPLATFFSQHGLELFDVERVSTKGGSFRAFVQRAGASRPVSTRLTQLIEREVREGMYEGAFYGRVERDLLQIRGQLRTLIDDTRTAGRGVAGYGVSVGTTTLLAQFQVAGDIDFLVDDAPGKDPALVGPGYSIPVVDREEMARRNPGIVIVFAWRYAQAIFARNEAYLTGGGAFVIPLPTVSVVRHPALSRG
jgi:SAM-dependent methyltransferase